MTGKRGDARRGLGFEILEDRIALSAAGKVGALSALVSLGSGHPKTGATLLYTANLGLTTAAMGSGDRASGFLKLRFNGDATQATVFGSLSNISNVSAIVLHVTPSKASPGSTTGQTVAILLKPGSGSGAVHHTTFAVSLSRFDLIGPLVGGPLSQLRDVVSQQRVLAVVQTTNGVDPTSASSPGALQPGNYPTGELSGIFEPMTTKSS